MLIYACISSHGYGHAARQATVFSALHRLQPSWRLVVSTLIPSSFLNLAFQGIPIEHRSVRWDVGMVQADALGIDEARTLKSLQTLEQDLPQIVDQEATWLKSQKSPILILGDVPPAAATLADRLDVPLVWMGNFGWDDIYEPLGAPFNRYAAEAKTQYRQGQLLLRCPFSLPMNWELDEKHLGLTVSALRHPPTPLRHHLEQMERPRGLVGFGGLGFSLSANLFQRWSSHHFLMPTPTDLKLRATLEHQSNITFLPQNIRPFDVMPFCKRHIGKPGYSTFCEGLSQKLGMHVVERDGFAEASVLMDGLRLYGEHRIIKRESFNQGDWDLDQQLVEPTQPLLSTEGAEEAAKAISDTVTSIVHNN